MEETGGATRVTQFLLDWGAGNRDACDAMLPLVYDELRRLASHYMRRERAGHTLQPTALVHETFLRLIDQRRVDWRNRTQFLGLAAKMMRRVLVNHARDRSARKRGGGAERVTLNIAANSFDRQEVNLIALDEALERLATLDPRKSQVVELKFFGGLTTAEIAEVLHLSAATIEREWSFARAWLYQAVAGEPE